MPQPQVKDCCQNYQFIRVADLAHADGIEFTLGRCHACHSFVVDCYFPSHNTPVMISKDTAEKMLAIKDAKLLKKFMSEWFDELT